MMGHFEGMKNSLAAEKMALYIASVKETTITVED
jgi:hypothetical protein